MAEVTAIEAHQVFIDEHRQLRERRVADLVLAMNLQAPKNTGVEPRDGFGKEIASYDLQKQRTEVGGKLQKYLEI